MDVYEYRIVKIEKGLFLIEYKTTPNGVWREVENKQFKTNPKAESWCSGARRRCRVRLPSRR